MGLNDQSKPMLLKSLLYIFAAATSAFGLEEADKIEVGCKPCPQPCPERCEESTALLAADLLINSLVVATNNDDLGLIQSMVNPKSTIQFNNDLGSGCIESPVMPFLNGYTPLLDRIYINSTSILSSYVDNKGRVIVTTEDTITLDGTSVKTYKNRYTFQACNGICGFSLTDLVMRDEACIV
jgi:hypothetical protein